MNKQYIQHTQGTSIFDYWKILGYNSLFWEAWVYSFMAMEQLMSCQNNLITEKYPAGAIMNHIFCWAGMNL